MHEKTVQKVSANTLTISSYYNGDAMDFVKEAPADAGFISFPPFKKAGKAFVKDFAKLEKMFKFTPPEYGFFDEELLKEYFRQIMTKKEWCFGTDMRLQGDEFTEHLKGMTKTTNRGIPIYLYASSGHPQIVTPLQSTTQANIKKFGQGMEMGDDIRALRVVQRCLPDVAEPVHEHQHPPRLRHSCHRRGGGRLPHRRLRFLGRPVRGTVG